MNEEAGPANHGLPQTTPPKEQELDILRIILAIILPPLGVFLQVGLSFHFFLNIVLTIIGFVPGIIHALWIILSR